MGLSDQAESHARTGEGRGGREENNFVLQLCVNSTLGTCILVLNFHREGETEGINVLPVNDIFTY